MEVPIGEHITTPGERGWSWFVEHAKSRFALLWLALIAFTDTVFSPFSAEPFLAALVLAHRDRWRTYLAVSLTFSCLGTTVGYLAFFWLYRSFGEGLLAAWGFMDVYAVAQGLLGEQIFFAMLLASFTPLPDKVFIYAAGILGAPFAPFMAGFILGRGARMAAVTYLVHRFGAPILEMVNKYSGWSAALAIAIFAIYATVHWNLLPW